MKRAEIESMLELARRRLGSKALLVDEAVSILLAEFHVCVDCCDCCRKDAALVRNVLRALIPEAEI